MAGPLRLAVSERSLAYIYACSIHVSLHCYKDLIN